MKRDNKISLTKCRCLLDHYNAIAYCEDAKKRGGGFGLSFLAFVILTAGALIAIVRQMV